MKLGPKEIKVVNEYFVRPVKNRLKEIFMKKGLPQLKTPDEIQRPERAIEKRNPKADGGRMEFQDGTDIKTILKKMAEDRTYEPPINLAAKGRGLPKGFRQAKKELREEISDFDELYKRNLTYRKKQKIKQKLKDDPEYKQTEMAKKAERRRRRRVAKVEDKVSLTPDEKFLNYQQSLITRQLNDKIKQNPDLILKNPILIDQLSTTISPDGNIIKVKPNLSQLKKRGIFEIEHQRDIYKKGKMKDFPYNRNLIMAPHNRAGGFKQMAESFIEKNPNSPKIDAILKKAEELKITLQPNVPQGTFTTKGIGYKQLPNAVNKFVDVAKSKVPLIVDENIGLPSSKKDLTMAKKALGMKISGSQLSANPFFSPGILKEAFKQAPTLAGAGVLNLLFGVDPTSAIDRASISAEAAFAPQLVKQAAKLGSVGQRIANIGLSPAMAARAARIASPIGIASLAAEGLYQGGKFTKKRIEELRSMTPEQRAELRRQGEAQAFDPFQAAGGGIAKLAGDRSGAMLTSMNPDKDGLPGLLKRGKK
jgi:hypothetical protein